MTLSVKNDTAKCTGQHCQDKTRCGRYLRPAGQYQVYADFWKAGESCQFYEIVPSEHHLSDDEPAKTEW